MKGLCGVEREPEHFLLDLITKTCHKHPICCFVAPLSLVRHSPQCCFSLIRAEFTSKLRLRAHLFAANSAFLNQEPDISVPLDFKFIYLLDENVYCSPCCRQQNHFILPSQSKKPSFIRFYSSVIQERQCFLSNALVLLQFEFLFSNSNSVEAHQCSQNTRSFYCNFKVTCVVLVHKYKNTTQKMIQ